ncbi:MAG: rhodanese-like domain-containing protein, partial [Thermomicrobiales bacterium]
MSAIYRDLFDQTRNAIREVDTFQARNLINREQAAILDVREQDEVDQGVIPGAVHIPRGFLEMRIEEAIRDKSQPVVVYCAGGVRSAFAAK